MAITKTTTETFKTSPVSITKSFQILGNKDGATVKKYRNHLGDGDIYTGSGGKVMCSVSAKLSTAGTNAVRLTLRYDVWESSYNENATKGSVDRLYIETYQDIDLTSFINEGRRSSSDSRTTVTTKSSIQLASTYSEAFYKAWYNTKDSRTGWMSIDPKDYPSENRVQSWMPLSNIRVKIDGSGSELTSVGNIGVSGTITFSVIRTDVVTKTIIDDDATARSATALNTGGAKAQLKLTDNITNVLGRGYDICDFYANSRSCKGFVFDIDKLNQYLRILPDTNEYSDYQAFSGEGVEEYTRDIETKLNIKVSAHAFGASFSNETKKSFKESSYKKEGYKMVTQQYFFKHASYTVDGYSHPPQLMPFLSSKFLRDLNEMSATAFINAYGTHVVLGMQEGARFNYNMMYRENITKKSTAKSFENTTSISYDKTGGIATPKQEPTKSNVETIYNDLTKDGLTADELKAFTEHITALKGNSNSNTNSKADASNKGTTTGNTSGANNNNAGSGKPSSNSLFGGGVEVGYSTSETTSSSQETKSTEISCSGIGGDVILLQKAVKDLSLVDTWWNTIRQNAFAFFDFIPGTLVPIYEFIPAGYRLTPAMVKKASDDYQASKGQASVEYRDVITTKRFSSQGTANTTVVETDSDIYSQSGKNTGWKLRAELVNFLDGTVGCAVAVNISEGGLGAGRSELQSHLTIPVPLSGYQAMAIDTSRLSSTIYTQQGTIRGQHHEWIDITEELRNCPFFNTYSDRIYIKIDGPGDDEGNIGIQLGLRVPVICYKNL